MVGVIIDRAYAAIRRAVGACSRALSLVAAGCILLMMFVMGGEVVSRATGNGSLPWAYGLIQLLLVMTVFLAAAFSEQSNEQIRVNLFTQRMPPRVAAIVRVIGNVLTLMLVLLLTVATGQRAVQSTTVGEYQDGVIAFPVWPARILVTLGLVFLSLELLFRIIDHSRTLSKGGIPETETVIEGEVIDDHAIAVSTK